MVSKVASIMVEGSYIGLVCLYSCAEVAQELLLTTDLDFGKPFKAPFVQIRPFEAGLTSVMLGIEDILQPSTGSQVSDSIVITNAVDMIHFMGPPSMDIDPSKMMFKVFSVVDNYTSVALSVI
jgi:hypothetical protein